MGKKKRGHPDVEEVISRPWCYYCERDFDDLKILINHQKAKHFKCDRCGRRLNTAGGLSVHMSQVHKETLSAVDNALPNRAGLDIEIFGMEGIPEDVIQQHTQRVLTHFHQAEAERRAATGNLALGSAAGGSQPKKPKFESPVELKKRLAEHKAKLAAEQPNGGGSGGGTPMGAGQRQSPSAFQAGSPQYPAQQHPYNAPLSSNPFGYSQPYGQSSPQMPPFQPPAAYAPQPTFSPPPYQSQPGFANQAFSPLVTQAGLPQPFQNGPSGGPPRPFGPNSPVQPFQHQQQVPARMHTPPQNGQFPQRAVSGSLPPAPGLPQRPAFGAPKVTTSDLRQMHQGQIPGLPNPPVGQHYPGANLPQNHFQQQHLAPAAGLPTEFSNTTSLDDLISDASKQAEMATSTQTEPAPEVLAAAPALLIEAVEEKTSKKEKDKSKASKLVYSDNEVSPEEKMARMPRYAYTPEKKMAMV